jgi:hypothetical protein
MKFYSSGDDFTPVGLVGMGYSHMLYKKTILNRKLISNRFFFKINILQVVMFQDVRMDPKILKEKQISLFFSMFFGIIGSFQKQIESLCLFNFIHIFTYNFIQMQMCVISFEYVKIISRD